jgi:hypothetical protein
VFFSFRHSEPLWRLLYYLLIFTCIARCLAFGVSTFSAFGFDYTLGRGVSAGNWSSAFRAVAIVKGEVDILPSLSSNRDCMHSQATILYTEYHSADINCLQAERYFGRAAELS